MEAQAIIDRNHAKKMCIVKTSFAFRFFYCIFWRFPSIVADWMQRSCHFPVGNDVFALIKPLFTHQEGLCLLISMFAFCCSFCCCSLPSSECVCCLLRVGRTMYGERGICLGRQATWQAGRQASSHAGRQTRHGQTDTQRQTHMQNRQLNRQADGKVNPRPDPHSAAGVQSRGQTIGKHGAPTLSSHCISVTKLVFRSIRRVARRACRRARITVENLRPLRGLLPGLSLPGKMQRKVGKIGRK